MTDWWKSFWTLDLIDPAFWIDILIDHTKSNRSKECIIFHYWFFNHGFKVQDSNIKMCINMIYVKYVNTPCIIHSISRFEAIKNSS